MSPIANSPLMTRRSVLWVLLAATPVALVSGMAFAHETSGPKYEGHHHGKGRHHRHGDDHHHGPGHHHGYADDNKHHGHPHRHSDNDHGPHHHGLDWQEKKS